MVFVFVSIFHIFAFLFIIIDFCNFSVLKGKFKNEKIVQKKSDVREKFATGQLDLSSLVFTYDKLSEVRYHNLVITFDKLSKVRYHNLS